ncbi:MAG: hypothetical protein L0Y56_00030, partial [Nitrospira sp.]|nr:hypothetical protein [Nitrospira sp.]
GGHTDAKKEFLALNLRNACLLQCYEHVHGVQKRKSVREVLGTLAFPESVGRSYRLRAAEVLQDVGQRRSRNDTVVTS